MAQTEEQLASVFTKNSNVNFTIFKEDESPDKNRVYSDQACNAGMYRSIPVDKKSRIFSLTKWPKGSQFWKGRVKYYDFLINRSMWKDAFITKDPEVATSSGVILTMDYPANYLLYALQCSRFLNAEYQTNSGAFVARALEEIESPVHPFALIWLAIRSKFFSADTYGYDFNKNEGMHNGGSHMVWDRVDYRYRFEPEVFSVPPTAKDSYIKRGTTYSIDSYDTSGPWLDKYKKLITEDYNFEGGTKLTLDENYEFIHSSKEELSLIVPKPTYSNQRKKTVDLKKIEKFLIDLNYVEA